MASAPQKKWHKLDNTANLFPVIASRRAANVFRMTAVLHDAVDPALLQKALEDTLPYFAAFAVRLRHGLFWSYLEQNDAPVRVQPEQEAPCRYIDPLETGRYLFRVLYFGPRISLETFHVLTDGTGAMRFLKALCYRYCQLAHPEDFAEDGAMAPHGIEQAGNVENEYVRNYVPSNQQSTYKEVSAYRLHGEYRPSFDMGVATLLVPLPTLKERCHAARASVGEYLTAAMLLAIAEEYLPARGAKKPVGVFVPVDLRRIFGTDTSANFFSGMSIQRVFDTRRPSFEELLEEVKVQFSEKLTRETFAQKLAYTVRSEVDLKIRIIPLPLKNGVLRLIYEYSNRGNTITFSNLGPVEVESQFQKYFEGFRFILSTTKQELIECTAVAYAGTLALTIATQLEDNALAKNIARRLTSSGIPVTVESTGGGE